MNKNPLTPEGIARKLVLVLEQHGISQVALAAELDMSPITLNHYLKGRRLPSMEFLIRLAARFPQLDLNWLLRDTPAEKNYIPQDPAKVQETMKEMKVIMKDLEKLLSQK